MEKTRFENINYLAFGDYYLEIPKTFLLHLREANCNQSYIISRIIFEAQKKSFFLGRQSSKKMYPGLCYI